MNWMDRAEQELEDDLNAGIITIKEYNQGLRDIQAEYDDVRQQAAQEAYDNY